MITRETATQSIVCIMWRMIKDCAMNDITIKIPGEFLRTGQIKLSIGGKSHEIHINTLTGLEKVANQINRAHHEGEKAYLSTFYKSLLGEI